MRWGVAGGEDCAASFRTAESQTLIVEGDSDSILARHSINKDRERGRLAQKANRSSRALA
jgi:hypothetical protein